MSLKTVLTNLSSAVQKKSGISGPLSLQEMTLAINNMSLETTSTKFYRCAEYSPASELLSVTAGLMKLADGRKISLLGEYIREEHNCWHCSATTASGEYLSVSMKIYFIEMIYSGTGANRYHLAFTHGELTDYDAVSQITANKSDIAYIADVVFTPYSSNQLEEEIILSGNTSSFIDVYSGYEVSQRNGLAWQESETLTVGLLPSGYQPETGKIYSCDSTLQIASIYPAPSENTIKFYECASYTPETAARTQFSFVLSGATDEKANGTYIRSKWLEDIPTDSYDYIISAKWVNENGYALYEETIYGEYTYYIRNSSKSRIYFLDSPVYERLNNYNRDQWIEESNWENITLNFSSWQTEELPATVESWSGYEMLYLKNDKAWLVTGADIENCNGLYTIYTVSDDPVYTVYSNGSCYLIAQYGGEEKFRWVICDNPNHGEDANNFYKSTPYFPYQTPLNPAEVKWSQYNSTDGNISTPAVSCYSGYWRRIGELTENMKVLYLTPKVGEIYSADTSIRVRRMYDGATYPITSEGLVFYAPLQSDYVDLVSGKAATVAGGTFTTHNGVQCLEMDGSDYVQWADNSDLPAGNVPYSFVVLIAPTDNYDWKCYVSMGAEEGSEICIHAKHGRLEEFGPANITTDGTWQCVALTRDAEGTAITYYNGKYDGTGTRTNSVPTPACVCVGANISGYFNQQFSGYIAFAAIYNRVLSAEEVAEISSTLMDM